MAPAEDPARFLQTDVGVHGVLARLSVLIVAILLSVSARAADLRVSLSELASLLNPILSDTSVRLHNVPSDDIFGGFFDPNQSSYVRFGGNEVPLDIAVGTFPLTGFGSGRYAYYLNDISTERIEVRPQSGTLRLVVTFEDRDAELVGGCASGNCGFTRALPIVQWRNPQVTIHLTPKRYNSGITLVASKVTIDGYFRATCRSNSILCPVGRRWAERYINRLRQRDLPGLILAQLNTAENRQTIADQLAAYMKIGSAGAISVTNVSVSSSTVRVSFRFP